MGTASAPAFPFVPFTSPEAETMLSGRKAMAKRIAKKVFIDEHTLRSCSFIYIVFGFIFLSPGAAERPELMA